MEDLYKLLKEQLTVKFGSPNKADEVLAKVGELVIMDMVEGVMTYVEEKEMGHVKSDLTKQLELGEFGVFLEIAKNAKVPTEKMFEKISNKVIQEIFGNLN